MGNRKRDKFSRMEDTDESNTSSEDESNTTSSTNQDLSGEENLNNNSNLKSPNANMGKTKNSLQYLETRSKRKYDKPETPKRGLVITKKQKLNNDTESLSSIQNEGRFEQCEQDRSRSSDKPIKKGRQTIKSLDSKIEEATSFLKILNEKINQRDDEIKKLKNVISQSRQVDLNNVSQNESLYNAIIADNKTEDDQMSTGGDNDVELDLQVAVRAEEDAEFSEVETEENKRESKPRGNRSRYDKDRKRKRSKSRSRSRSRNKSNFEIFRQNSPDRERISEEDDEHYRSNPQVQKLVKRMVEEQVEREMKKRMKLEDKQDNQKAMGMNSNAIPIVKSPSDSATIYVPAVKRLDWNTTAHLSGSPDLNRNITQKDITPSIQEHVNNGISQLRIISDGARPSTSRSEQEPVGARLARSAAENAILEAERFRARIQSPDKGMSNKGIKFNNNNVSGVAQVPFEQEQLRHLRYLDNEDDEFFHTTCHIDSSMKEKISKGSFVELDRLLQKKLQSGHNDNRLQLINKDGASFFVPPVDREKK